PKGINTLQEAFKIAWAANQDFFNKLSDKENFVKELQRIIRMDEIVVNNGYGISNKSKKQEKNE
ncbi:MAG: hypothetical protein WBN19_10385, partial [Lutimonas sp.]